MPPAAGALRVAFITDVHIQPEREAVRNFDSFMSSIYRSEAPPDLILNGGDIVMDAVAADRERVDTLWSVWRDATARYQTIPVHYCLGNHDIWGWSKKSFCTGDEPLFGKNYFLKEAGLVSPYYSFDLSGWRFIVLDSLLRLDASRYAACLDPEQRAWLETVLNDTAKNMPVLVLSHIPIMGGASVFFATAENTVKREMDGSASKDWIVPSWQMHADAVSLIDLFARHGNVKLCLSGHTHVHDVLYYRGIGFVNGGAVCGQWWRGEFFGTPPGYVSLDLYPDGSYKGAYVPTYFDN
jgi:Icc protein